MKHGPEALDECVRAFARTSAAPAGGRATRARVLGTASRQLQRRATWRRTALGLFVAVGAALSGGAAWTAVGRWRAVHVAPTLVVARHMFPASETRAVPRVAEVLPSRLRDAATAAEAFDAEGGVYRRAHEAHFDAEDPRAALAAWNRYLATYPRGTFAPEARFNRALCLVRVGRREAAVAALRPFAHGAYGSYRREEAAALIEAIAPDDPP